MLGAQRVRFEEQCFTCYYFRLHGVHVFVFSLARRLVLFQYIAPLNESLRSKYPDNPHRDAIRQTRVSARVCKVAVRASAKAIVNS